MDVNILSFSLKGHKPKKGLGTNNVALNLAGNVLIMSIILHCAGKQCAQLRQIQLVYIELGSWFCKLMDVYYRQWIFT